MSLFTNLKIGARLSVAIVGVAVIILIIGGLSYFNVSRLDAGTNDIIQSTPLVDAAMEMKNSILGIRFELMEMLEAKGSGELAEAWSRVEEYARTYRSFSTGILEGAETEEGMVYAARNEEVKELVRNADQGFETALIPAMKDIDAVLNEAFTDFNLDTQKLRELRDSVTTAAENMMKDLDQVEDEARDEVRKAEEISHNTADSTRLIVLIGSLMAIVLAAVFGKLLAGTITRPLEKCVTFAREIEMGNLTAQIQNEGNDEIATLVRGLENMRDNLARTVSQIINNSGTVATAAEELSATTDELARGAREQSSQTEQAATATTEMSQTILDVARNAGDAADAAKESSRLGKEGSDTVEKTVSGMTRIAETVSELAGVIKELGSSSQEIGKIVSVIDDIAEQTNLLALNAAIEAARAGEQGRGFAVVADEVRKLAERTGTATKEIATMIQKIQNETEKSVKSMDAGKLEVSRGVALAEEAKDSMDKIVASSDRGMDMIQRIATAAEEQSAAAEEVSASMESISSVTRSTQGAAEEIRGAVQNLAQMASELRQATEYFRLSGSESQATGSHPWSQRMIGKS